jgi:GAF domain-containing protein
VDHTEYGDIAKMFAEFALTLHNERGFHETVESVVTFALHAVDCDHASLVLVRKGHLEVAAATDTLAEHAIRMQLARGEGPCLAGIADRASIHVPDTHTDPRWPDWAAGMAELGLRSVLSVHVHAGTSTTGALNLVAKRPNAFGPDDEAVAHILARHAAVAVATAQQQATLALAIDARKVVGQAQGILMERYDLDADKAFAVLRRYSQQNNLKLSEVARRLIATRRLPESRTSRPTSEPDPAGAATLGERSVTGMGVGTGLA